MLNVGYLWKAVRFIYSFKYLFLLFYKMCVYVCLWICADEWRCPQKLEGLDSLEPELHAVVSEPPGMGPLQSCVTLCQQALPQTADLFCKVESMKWPQFSLSLNLKFSWNKIYILSLLCESSHTSWFAHHVMNEEIFHASSSSTPTAIYMSKPLASMSNVSRHIIQCAHHPIQ